MNIDLELEELDRTIDRAVARQHALRQMRDRILELEKAIDSPKETLIRLEHVDLGQDLGQDHTANYRGELRAYEVEAPSALVSPIRFRETADYSFYAYDLLRTRQARQECLANAAARLGKQMFSRFFERTK